MSVRIRPGDEPEWQQSLSSCHGDETDRPFPATDPHDVALAQRLVAGDDYLPDANAVHDLFAEQQPTGDTWPRSRRSGWAATWREWPAPPWKRIVAAGLVAAVFLLMLGGLAYRLSIPAAEAPAKSAAETGSATTGVEPPPSTASAPASASPDPEVPPADMMAMPWHGAALPVSGTAGPHHFTDTRSYGFTRDPQGAALAAVHISTHIDPYTGPDVFTPTIEEQVIGVTDLVSETQAAYEQAAQDRGLSRTAIADGTPVLAPTGDISAWRIKNFRLDAITTVELLVATPQGEQLVYEIPVVWRDGDWRITFEGSDRGPTFRTAPPSDLASFTPFIEPRSR